MRFLSRDPVLNSKKGIKILGVLGSQGSGKTFLSRMMGQCLELQGKKVIYFSSDDFYLTYDQRMELMKSHPFLKFR